MNKFIFILLILTSSWCLGQSDLKQLYDSARLTSNLELAKQVNIAAQNANDRVVQANSFYLIAYLHKNDEKFYEAVSNYFDALEIYRSLDDKQQIANVTENIANIYSKTGFHDAALDYYYDALVLKTAINDTQGVNKINSHIAFQYQQLGQHDTAIQLYKTTIADAEAVQDSSRLYWIYNNMGRLHRLMKNYADADETYKKALDFTYNAEDKVGIYNNIGYLRLCMGDTTSAHKNLNTGLSLLNDSNINDSDFTGTIYSNLGIIYASKKSDSSFLFFEKSYAFLKNHRLAMSGEYFEICKKLKSLKRERGNLNEALAYSDDIDQLTTELLDLRVHLNDMYNQYQVEAATYKYQSEEKARELAKQLQVDQYIKWALAALSVILITLSFILYRKNRKIRFAQDTARKIYQVIHS